MPKTHVVYARLRMRKYDDVLTLSERASEINERLYTVLNDEFYMKKLTDAVRELHPLVFEKHGTKKEKTLSFDFTKIDAVGKFAVTDQKVDLLDIRFY